MRWVMSACVALATFGYPAVADTMKITVAEPSGVERTGWPVTSGVPLAEGALKDPAAAALFSSDGRELPLQTEALARWPDGSVRWLLLDFQTDLTAKQTKTFSLRCGPDVRGAEVDRPVRIEREVEALVIDTGPLRLKLPPEGYHLPSHVMLDLNRDGRFTPEERVTRPAPDVHLVDDQGRLFTSGYEGPSRAKMVVEQSGPLRACVRIEGHHAGGEGRMFRYVVRIHAFRGRPFVRFFYTLINDHQDSLMARIRYLDLHFKLAEQAGATPRGVLDGEITERGYLFQVDENRYELDRQPAGRRAPGWAAAFGEKAGLAVGMREFWQNWPKSIEYGSGGIFINVCPPLFGEGYYDGKPLEEENKLYYHLRDNVHTFKCGVARSHELWATFFAGPADVKKLSAFFRAAEEPLLATCRPQHVSSTKAAGEFPPADGKKYAGYDAWLGRALDAHLKRRERLREYGMLNYGDWYGERKVNWGNLEYDLAHGLFLQYLRTGDRRFYLRAEQAARHHIDVDVVHAVNPHLKNPWGPPPQVGEIWLHCLNHTGGYYRDAPLPVSRTYQMGHSTNFGHVWVSGDLDYYYLTGDRRAREVAVEIADAMVRHMPTGYGTHIRALGWPMILVLRAYHATGEKKYLDAATKNWQVLKENIDWQRGWVVRLAKGHCLHEDRRCEGNVPFMEGLTLCALARYHRVTKDPEVLRAIGVGIDQMVRECWQEDAKTFSYTACPLSSRRPYALFMLSVEAMAYEAALTGNREHLRVLREGLRAAIPQDDGHHEGKGLAQMIFFAPHALAALGD